MATTGTGTAAAHLVFRSRAVRVAGLVELAAGAVIVLAGIGLASLGGIRDALPIGLVMTVLGAVLIVSGLGRATARMDITRTHLTWTWSFSRHELALEDLNDAALVEKGAPASGAEWSGFLGRGIVAVAGWWLVAGGWWLYETAWAQFMSEPSLGNAELVWIEHHGGPVSVKPIGAWTTSDSHSEANRALGSLQAAIAASARAPACGARPAPHGRLEPDLGAVEALHPGCATLI